jgi:hypothetical protein
MTQKEREYRGTLKYFENEYGLTEERFLHLYYLKGEERENEYAKLPEDLGAALVHLRAAYNGYRREQEEKQKGKNDKTD